MDLINSIWQRTRAFFNSRRRADEGVQREAAKSDSRDHDEQQHRKGDAALLGDQEAVTFRTAERYLGITERQRQKLVKNDALKVIGRGQNRRITTESLRRYLPPKKSN